MKRSSLQNAGLLQQLEGCKLNSQDQVSWPRRREIPDLAMKTTLTQISKQVFLEQGRSRFQPMLLHCLVLPAIVFVLIEIFLYLFVARFLVVT